MSRLARLVAVASILLVCLPGGALARPPIGVTVPAAERAPAYDSLGDAVRAGAVESDVAAALLGRRPVDVLLVLDPAPALARATELAGGSAPGRERAVAENARREFAALKKDLLARHGTGMRLLEDYDHLGLAKVRLSSAPTLLEALNERTVRSVRLPRARTTALAESLPLVDQPEAVALGYDGANTSVAVLDTGLDYQHAAFGSCTAPGIPAETCRVPYVADIAPADGFLDDALRHGTNVAGIVAGVAPAAKVIGLDVFDGDGAWDDDVVRALNWVVANRATYRIRAANLSLGDGTYNNSACWYSVYAAAFASLRAVGVVPVASAGNYAGVTGGFTSGIGEPACAPGAISVGAVYDSAQAGPVTWGPPGEQCTDSDIVADRITCFSQSGVPLAILAPGAMITAAGITMGGTSQAAPHVSGAAAVVAGERPSATAAEVQAALVGSGTPIVDPRNNLTRRRLDVDAAVAAVLAAPSALRFEFPVSPSQDYGWSFGQSLALTGSTLHHVFATPEERTGQAELRYVRSTNAGASWSSTTLGFAPWLYGGAVAAAGTTVHAAWTHFQTPDLNGFPRYILYTRNTANGVGGWSEHREITSSGLWDAPSIAASGSYVYMAYANSITGDVYFRKSSDRGATWAAPVRIGTTTASNAFGRWASASIAASSGYVGVAFRSNNTGAIRALVSTNRGGTWSGATLVTASTTGPSVSAASGRLGFAWVQSNSVRYRSWKGSWQTTRSLYTLGPDRAHKSSTGVSVALLGTSGVGLAFSACISASCAGTKSGTGVDLVSRESTTDGASWGPSRVIASGRSTDLRHINDAPDFEWASSSVRHVAFNGWTNTDTGWSQMYMVTGRGPSP